VVEMKDREPNSQECEYFGRKLSNHCCNDVEVSGNAYLSIGSERDDEIYFNEADGKYTPEDGMIKERVLLSVSENVLGFSAEIDLEDLLRFAAKNCAGIYERVYKETK
jgi:hypothetical protein